MVTFSSFLHLWKTSYYATNATTYHAHHYAYRCIRSERSGKPGTIIPKPKLSWSILSPPGRLSTKHTFHRHTRKSLPPLNEIWPTKIDRREKVVIVYLDRIHRVLGHEVIFTGGNDSCTTDSWILFRYTLREDAHSILLAHNHPTSDCSESR